MESRGLSISLIDILMSPLLLPARGLLFILEELRNVVDRELYDEAVLRRRLLELEMARELGELSEQAYRQEKAKLGALLSVLQDEEREQSG